MKKIRLSKKKSLLLNQKSHNSSLRRMKNKPQPLSFSLRQIRNKAQPLPSSLNQRLLFRITNQNLKDKVTLSLL